MKIIGNGDKSVIVQMSRKEWGCIETLSGVPYDKAASYGSEWVGATLGET